MAKIRGKSNFENNLKNNLNKLQIRVDTVRTYDIIRLRRGKEKQGGKQNV